MLFRFRVELWPPVDSKAFGRIDDWLQMNCDQYIPLVLTTPSYTPMDLENVPMSAVDFTSDEDLIAFKLVFGEMIANVIDFKEVDHEPNEA